MIEIRRLTIEEMILNKEIIINLFEKNIKKYPPCVDDSQKWYEASLIGHFQLWGIIESELKGIFLTVIDGNCLNAFCLTGKDILNSVKEISKVLSDFAKNHSIRWIQTLSSPALARKVYRQFDQRPLVLVTLDTWEKV